MARAAFVELRFAQALSGAIRIKSLEALDLAIFTFQRVSRADLAALTVRQVVTLKG